MNRFHRPRYRRRELGNCLACDFGHYTSQRFDKCVHHDPQTRKVHEELMRAGRVGMNETPMMRAFRTCGDVPYTPRRTMFRTSQPSRRETLAGVMRANRGRGLYDLPDAFVRTR